MNLTFSAQFFALFGAFLGSMFALVRYAMQSSRATADRFVAYLESALHRQEDVNTQFQGAIENLSDNVRDNSAVLQRVAERLGLS